MKNTLMMLGLVIAGCRTGSGVSTLRDDAASADTAPRTVEAMKAKVAAAPAALTTIASLIALLPEDMRRTYLLMFHSKSRQLGSFDAPRVVMFGPDAKLLVGFNGQPMQPGYSLLEMIEWNQADQAFDFFEVREQGGRLIFSEKNPPICGGCHTANMGDDDPRRLRPNWESFAAWPGAYAGAGTGTQPSGKYFNILANSDEEKGLDAFKATAGNNDRYKHLLDLDKKYIGTDTHDPDTQPNNDFMAKLKRLNGQRIARWITNDPSYPAMRTALAHALANCADYESLMPAKLKTTDAAPLDQTLAAALQSYQQNPTNLTDEVIKKDLLPTTLEPLAKVRRLYQLKGDDINHWSLSPTITDSFLDARGEKLIKPSAGPEDGFLAFELAQLDPTFALPTCP